MALINWTDNLSVGIKEIDEQHKKLIQYVNDLHAAMASGKSKEVMGGILDNLITYTKTHFQHEENLMSKHGYAEIGPHKAEHMELTTKAIDIQQRYKSGTTMISLEVMQFLKDWLSKHILGTDKKYGPFLNSKGIK